MFQGPYYKRTHDHQENDGAWVSPERKTIPGQGQEQRPPSWRFVGHDDSIQIGDNHDITLSKAVRVIRVIFEGHGEGAGSELCP